jgi:hypothetical protein
MAFIHGMVQAFLIHNENISRFLSEGNFSCSKDTSDVTTMGCKGKAYLSGLRDGKMSIKGFYDTELTGNSEILESEYNSETKLNALYAPAGLSFGMPAKLAEVDMTSLESSNPIADAVDVSGELQASDGIGHGKILTDGAAKTATGNGSAYLGADAATTKGAVAHLHITEISGTDTPSATVKIQHSADNSTWADLVTFDAATAKTSQRVKIAEGVTINKYTRAQWTITGTNPSFDLTVAMARKK